MTTLRTAFITLLTGIVLFTLVHTSCTSSTGKGMEALFLTDELYTDPPNFGSYPATRDQIQKMIDDVDLRNIRAHAWDLWGSMTSPGPQGLPVWETWYSGYEVFTLAGKQEVKARNIIRDFQSPKQFHHFENVTDGVIPQNLPEQITSFNRYTKSVADFIVSSGLNRAQVLDSINDSFDRAGTPISLRQIQTTQDSIDTRAIVLKPVFQFIDGFRPTVIPFWNGISPKTTTDLKNPEPHTWRQGVIVDPTRTLKPGDSALMSVNNEPARWLQVVGLEDFYAIKLTEEDVKEFSDFAATSGDDVGKGNMTDSISIYQNVKEGNYALLMAVHVTSKEINNWTWQTFWWSPYNNHPFFGADRPTSILAPWDNYNMRTAYWMVTPAGSAEGEPFVSFNPYLETNLFGKVPVKTKTGVLDSISWTGVNSNCMTCHRLAARAPGTFNTPAYQPDGFIGIGDSVFAGMTKVDFLWSVAIRPQ
ncbi:MAG: hypothetical protein RIC30_01295 [Marinoscillum sp.]|uniref:hypothetical protein n=2 Tax=Marinoscillum sp. TaxID=2024838 RepID=UPI0032F7EBA2